MLNLVANGPSGYTINNSLRLRRSASAYLNRTPASTTNQQTWTYSAWIKRGLPDSSTGHQLFNARSSASPTFQFSIANDTLVVDATGSIALYTTQVLRDFSAWYHVMLVLDTTQATAANRMKMYLNGTQITSFSTATYPAQNATLNINTNTQHGIGSLLAVSRSEYYDGYMAEVNFIDGQALTPSSFGQTSATTGVWQPKQYTGTYGTNGFYLKFSDIATTSGSNAGLGKDFSGNGNYWTTNNISVTSGTTYDAMIDSPTNAASGTQPVGNYAVLNPLAYNGGTASNGNLLFTGGATAWQNMFATMGVSSGLWYWEMTATNVVTSVLCASIASPKMPLGFLPGQSSIYGVTYYPSGNIYYNSSGPTAYGSSWTTGDVIGIALDMNNGKVWFSKNGTWQNSGNPATGTNPAVSGLLSIDTIWMPITGAYYSGSQATYNFGQRPFAYTPPSGFQALCTTNLPDSTIVQGNKYMDATLYTGTGSSLSITNAGSFQPDFVWMKSRSAATDNAVFDSNRGTTKELITNSSAAETTQSTGLTAFNSNGFTIGAEAKLNTNAATYVAWQWQAGLGVTSSNTSGTITSTVDVSTTAGVSIVTYTGNGSSGATFGHGLGVAPKFVIINNRNVGGTDWNCYHASLGNGGGIYLNRTDGYTASASFWNNTTPTSTLVTLGSGSGVNASTRTYVAYCFAEIAGFSKFGSYTGNGSTDGPFVYLGFRPKWVLIKQTSAAGQGWVLYDTSRNPYNLTNLQLDPNDALAESDQSGAGSDSIDINSNGFKVRNTGSWVNTNAATYIYACFAENPFGVNCRAR